jgi:hypothetical protein
MPRPVFNLAMLTLGILIGYLAARWPTAWVSVPTPASIRADSPATPASDEPDPGDTNETENLASDEPSAASPDNDPPVPITPDTLVAPITASAVPWPAGDEPISIPRKFYARIQCPIFNTTSNCLTDDIVELLHITRAERDNLNRLIIETRTRIEANELERAIVTEQSPTRVVLQIAANPEVGREAESAYTAGVLATLGDRANDFLPRAQLYHATLFNNFGRNETTLTVTRDEQSNLLRVQSRQEYNTPSGRASATSTTMSEKMPSRWHKFFQAP